MSDVLVEIDPNAPAHNQAVVDRFIDHLETTINNMLVMTDEQLKTPEFAEIYKNFHIYHGVVDKLLDLCEQVGDRNTVRRCASRQLRVMLKLKTRFKID